MMPHPTLLDQNTDGTDSSAGAPSAVAPAAPAAAQPAAAAPAPAAVQWPDNWREAYAGGDAKKLARLQRYGSPTAALDAMLAAQQKISSGEFRANTPFPEKGTPEEQASWRAERGIPTEPTGYDLTLGDGIVLGDEDKPAVDSFLKSAHAANVPADAAKAALKWYHEFKTTQAEQIYERDVAWKEEAEEALRAEWGGDFQRNRNLVKSLVDTAPEGLRERLASARLADGRPIFSDPDMLKFFVGIQREINPAGVVVPGSGGSMSESIFTEMAKLEAMMGNRSSEYWKGSNSERLQARYRELVAAKAKMEARNKAA